MRSPHTRTRGPLCISIAAFTALNVLATATLAQDPPVALGAKDLREKARAAMQAGDVAGACLLFEQSYQASKAQNSGVSPDEALFELAECHVKQGKTSIAAAEFDQVSQGQSHWAGDARKRLDEMKKPPLPAPAASPPGSPQAPGSLGADTPTPPVILTQQPEAPTRVGDFMDTRLTWTFGDDDVLHATGVATPLSQNFNIGDRRQYRLFFDNLNSRFAGRENLTHLALYKKMPGFIKRLDTEASLLVRLDIASLASGSNNVNQALYDAGSFIRLFYHFGADPKGRSGLGLTLWPIDTDRFRLGYLYDISWGGTAASINQSIFPRLQGIAPGGKLQVDGDFFSVYVGFKTASIVQVEQTLTPGTSDIEQIRVGQANYGFLGGASVDIGDYVHIDAGGGYFQQGKFDLPDVAGKQVFTAGFSTRLLVHHKDMPVPQSIDFALYRNDPNKPQVIFRPETYTPGKTTWAVSAEYSNLWQNLKDFDRTGQTALQQARAAAVQANVKSGFFRGSLTGIFRDLPFVLRNQPSFIPFETLPQAASTTNEIFVAAAADYYFAGPRLTPGLGGGLQLPATFRTESTDSSSSPISRTVVVREQGNLAILPVNRKAVPIIQARASLRWDISPILAATVWVQYIRDNNGTFVERDPGEGTVALRTFIKPDFLGFGTAVQARF